MVYNIGDNIKVLVGDKRYNGLVIEIKQNSLVVIYVGKNSNGSAFAIMDEFDLDGNIIQSWFYMRYLYIYIGGYDYV